MVHHYVVGVAECVDEIDAQRVLGYVLYMDGKDATISFPLERFLSNVAGRSFHNGRFIQRLREKAASLHKTRDSESVTSLLEENGIVKGVHYKDKSGQVLTAYAPLTILCDGCFSNLRRSLCNPKIDVPSYSVGLVLTNCKLPCENYGVLVIAPPSPFVFYLISCTEIRCLVDVPSRNLPSVSDGEMADYLKTQVAPKVPPQLYTGFISAIVKKGNIRIMPNKIMAVAPYSTPGAILIGDAFNMCHALTGGGVTVALSDVLLRHLLRPLEGLSDPFTICKYLESFYTLRKPMSSTINTLANLLHKVLSASSNPAMDDIQQACFDYLRLGGVFAYGLSALHSDLRPCPLSLAFHFLAIAIYTVGLMSLPFPSPKRLWNGAKLLRAASSIVFPFIQSERVTQMFFPLTVPAHYRTPPRNERKP